MTKNFELRETGNDEFDLCSLSKNVPFTQASFYGDWQKSLNRSIERFVVFRDEEAVAYFQLIKYPLLFGKSYFYIPYGPVTKDFSDDFFCFLKKELKRISQSKGIVFVRLDFTPLVSQDVLSKFFVKAKPYTYHSAYFQPRTEWFLGLEKSEEDLMSAMHKKTRYAIRLAERKGITAEIVTADFGQYFDNFYELMDITAKRNGFQLHRKMYYENIFESLHKTNSYLSIARYGQKILAIDMIVVFEKIANYVFGGSSDEERNRMPTYLAQWKAICCAKKLKCDYYNFGGISTDSKIYEGWGGLTLFKKKFGGKEVIHSDFFDIVVKPFWYQLYNLRKRLKKFSS